MFQPHFDVFYKVYDCSKLHYPYIIRYNNRSDAVQTHTIANVREWSENDGAKAGVIRSGATTERPAGYSIYIGFKYFDTTLGKPIYASAISGDTVTWVDATGATV